MDDGSTDSTEAVASAFCQKDARFRYLRKPNGGLSSARNAGLRNVRGNWIQFLDADDTIEATKFEKHLRQIEQSGFAHNLVTYCDYRRGHQDNIRIEVAGYIDCEMRSAEHLRELIDRWERDLSIPAHSFVFSSRFFFSEGITFNESLPNHEDFDCWLKIFALNPTVRYISEKLCTYRRSVGSMSSNMRSMGEGFLQMLDGHIQSQDHPVEVRKLLLRKRREVLKTYNCIDRMTFKEKCLSLDHLSCYYWKRFLQKSGMAR